MSSWRNPGLDPVGESRDRGVIDVPAIDPGWLLAEWVWRAVDALSRDRQGANAWRNGSATERKWCSETR